MRPTYTAYDDTERGLSGVEGWGDEECAVRVGDNGGHGGVRIGASVSNHRFHTHTHTHTHTTAHPTPHPNTPHTKPPESPDIGTYHSAMTKFYKNRYRSNSQRDESGVGKPTHTSAQPTGATFCRVLGFLVSRGRRVSTTMQPRDAATDGQTAQNDDQTGGAA